MFPTLTFYKPDTLSSIDMTPTVSPPGAQHEAFTEWVKAEGVRISGVTPAKISGRGLGIVTERRIEAGEELVKVPASVLLSTDVVPEHFKTSHKGITVHGLLASFLAFGGSEVSHYLAWKASWPSFRELQESMPILWSEVLGESSQFPNPTNCNANIENLSSFLPPSIGGKWRHLTGHSRLQRDGGMLSRQAKKLKADWEIVSNVFPDRTLADFTYHWLIVNTRSFYFDALDGDPPEMRDDRMVLCPFVDYFNHQDHGCEVTFNEEGYVVTSDRAYNVGEEIYTSYGAHGNDFLLVEYGFLLDTNKWDSLSLDDFFCGDQLDEHSKNCLKNAGYFGDYTLTAQGVCHRTQVAIRTQTLNRHQWSKFVAQGETNEEGDELGADSYLCREVLKVYYQKAEDTLQSIRKMPDSELPPHISNTLSRRLEQTQALIRSAFRNDINRHTQTEMHEMFELPAPPYD